MELKPQDLGVGIGIGFSIGIDIEMPSDRDRDCDPDSDTDPDNCSPRMCNLFMRHRVRHRPMRGCYGNLTFNLEAFRQMQGCPMDAEKQTRHSESRPEWLVAAGLMLLALGLIGGYFLRLLVEHPQQPNYQRLTFRRGIVRAARFAPDGKTVFYGAAWEGDLTHVFSVQPGSPEFHPMVMSDAIPLSVSPSAGLAFLLKPRGPGWGAPGTLAWVPLSGGAPHAVLQNVRWADWDRNGEMAVVRDGERGRQLEYPAGKVLFSTQGWISHPRFSRAGDRIAFLHHPAGGDDSQVVVVTPAGKAETLSADSGSAQGLAWTPAGDEIWFTAGTPKRDLRAVTLTGAVRTVLAQTTSLTLEDISHDGRVLLISTNARLSLQYVGPGRGAAQDLSWEDWSLASDISADGRVVVFTESGEGAAQNEVAYCRRTDGSPAVRLGNGSGPKLSPDGRSVAAVTPERRGLAIFSVGTGETRNLPLTGFRIGSVAWLPGGRGVLFSGSQEGPSRRLYSLALDGSSPKVIAPEGIAPSPLVVSPSGRYIALRDMDRRVLLYPLPGGDPQVCPGIEPGEIPVAWTPDETFLYVRRFGLPARIYRVDWHSGHRELWREIVPPETAGVSGISSVVMTPDGQSYAYSHVQTLSALFLVDGLR